MYLTTILIAISAFTYSIILTQPGMLFYKLYKLAEKYLPAWLHKPIISCEYCVGGQWALWIYIYYNFHTYNLVEHILFILVTIYLVGIVKALYLWINSLY